MKVLVINSGSSSLKYQLFNMETEGMQAKGLIQRIRINDSFLEYENSSGEEIVIEKDIPTHKFGIELLLETLLSEDHGVLESIDEVEAVGYRIVHGGEGFAHSTIIDKQAIKKLEEVADLEPLHTPPNIMGIKVCQELMPDKPQVGVFDTAFHHSMFESIYLCPAI
jgi:acetate kinase